MIAAALCSVWPQGGARQRAVCCFIGEADEASEMEALSSSPNRSQPQGGRFEIETTKEASMRYTYVRQHDTTDCAAACLAMVCLHYKKEITITRLRDMMGTDLKGTNLTGMEKAAQELGFSTAAVRV